MKRYTKRIASGIAGVLLTCSVFSMLPASAGGGTYDAMAAQTEPSDAYDHLTVGTTTAFDGAFFTGMWGNVSSDIDVRALIHGYNLVEWRSADSTFGLDPSVVSGAAVTENEKGDRTYLLTLYDDMQYSDGTYITAKDYAFSLLLSISEQLRAIGATTKDASYLAGYEEYVSGEVPYLSGVRLLSDQMISVTIRSEFQPFFYELALLDCTPYPISVIAPECEVRDDGDGIYIANEDEEKTEPVFTEELLRETILDPEKGYLSHPSVTSGPYRIVSYDGETVELERNDYYKGNSSGNVPRIERLTYRVMKSEDMVDELEEGDVMLLNKVVNADALKDGMHLTAENDAFRMSNYARNGLSYISFCCEKDTVGSSAVRQAIAHCFDKDEAADLYVSNFGLRADGYYGIGQWMYQIVNGTLAYPVEETEGGSEQGTEDYEETLKSWEELSLENVKTYDLDVREAVRLLEEDGWVLNADGRPFDPDRDKVRCRQEDGSLTALDLKILVPEGNQIVQILEGSFTERLQDAGIALQVECLPMEELLAQYYMRGERSCDMIYLATNFDVLFDPSQTFCPPDGAEDVDADASDAAGPGSDEEQMLSTRNTTHIDDAQLYELALDMIRTQPGDALSYCRKWVAFQERFAEVLPVLPVYSNVYFDFYTSRLQDYEISSSISWGHEIVNAYLGDASQAEEETEAETEEGEFIFVD